MPHRFTGLSIITDIASDKSTDYVVCNFDDVKSVAIDSQIISKYNTTNFAGWTMNEVLKHRQSDRSYRSLLFILKYYTNPGVVFGRMTYETMLHTPDNILKYIKYWRFDSITKDTIRVLRNGGLLTHKMICSLIDSNDTIYIDLYRFNLEAYIVFVFKYDGKQFYITSCEFPYGYCRIQCSYDDIHIQACPSLADFIEAYKISIITKNKVRDH